MTRSFVRWLAAASACAPAVHGQAPPVHTVEVGGDMRVNSALVMDAEGDGRSEVAVAVTQSSSLVPRRLLVFGRPEGAASFAAEPQFALDLTPDVAAWTVGDVHAREGDEIVLLSSRGAFAWLPGAEESEAFVRLVEADLLWQATGSERAFEYVPALVDWSGDGRLDLALPEPGGYRFAAQLADGGFGPASELAVPAAGLSPEQLAGDYPRWRPRISTPGVALAFGGGDNGDGGGPPFGGLLSVFETVPAPQLLDWNGDRRPDVLAQGESRLHVWLQHKTGFAERPDLSLELPVAANRERRLDASYSSHAVELNGDGRADVVILSGDKRSDDVRTQLQVFVQGAGRGAAAQTSEAPLFGPKGIPQQLLVLAGFVALATFPDLDGDGLADLVVRAVRPDLIDSIRSAASETIDADFYLYRNVGGRFSERPDFSWKVQIPIREFDLTMRFIGDINRDGWSDLLLRDRPERVRIMALWERRGKLELFEEPLAEVAVDEEARILPLSERGILVLEHQRVLWMELP